MQEKTISRGVWMVKESQALSRLTIAEGASIAAPEGKYLTLTVNGVTCTPRPGTYEGDVYLTVSDNFTRTSLRFGEKTVSNFHAAVILDDGRIVESSSVLAALQGGQFSDKKAQGVRIESREWDFNGFYITGDSQYEISNTVIALEGDGTDDFVGMGAAIAAAGNAEVTIRNTEIHTKGIGRGTLFVGENARVTMDDCQLHAEAKEPTPEELEAGRAMERMMEPPWSIGLRGNVRTLNLAGNGVLTMNRCHCTCDRWGVLSIDGARLNRMYVNDSLVEITGDNGYGCFCIADDIMFDYDSIDEPGCLNVIDHSTFNVAYTGALMSLGNGCVEFKNGAVVNSKRFGVFCHRHNGGWLKINSGAQFHTDASCMVVKGSNLHIELDDAVMEAKNGTILQLMDNDDVGMCDDPFLIPVGEVDVRDDRDLATAIPDEDIFVKIAHMEVTGDFLNSTTNFRACNRRQPKPADCPPPPPPPPGAEKLRGFLGDALMGAKNLDIYIENATVNGVISAANAFYKDGLTQITKNNCQELSNITQIPAPPVNNGVIVTVADGGVWNVTGDCYLTKLTIAKGGRMTGIQGKKLTMTVDGTERGVEPGEYTGLIQLTIA